MRIVIILFARKHGPSIGAPLKGPVMGKYQMDVEGFLHVGFPHICLKFECQAGGSHCIFRGQASSPRCAMTCTLMDQPRWSTGI